jgi:ABC-type uncharacterized transport system substrate-binding protein
VKRRTFISLVGGATAWPLVGLAQQSIPMVGFVHPASPEAYLDSLSAFRKGLAEEGYAEGRNVGIEYRWAKGEIERLPQIIAELIKRPVDVLVATGTPAALAAKATSTSIPIIFQIGDDPVRLKLISSFSRPGGNITGVTQTNTDLAAKRLQLLHELIPTARRIGLLVDQNIPTLAETTVKEVEAAARAVGVELQVAEAATDDEIDRAFYRLMEERVGGLVIGGGSFLISRSKKLAALAWDLKLPAIFQFREFTAARGLISYGSDITHAYYLAGLYTGRILKGTRPAELPIQQAAQAEMIINLEAAKRLGITIPLPLIGRADEVIE